MTAGSDAASSGSVSGDAVPALEMWAGVECTINRVGNHHRDQRAISGGYQRPGDADRLADLGVRVVRWPVLWERHVENAAAWRASDHAMDAFRRRGIEPIVGLVHHGSGPIETGLLDDGFGAALAGFAERVAMRYPWVTRFTPINEPLTTARFSALYGLWYPHARNDSAFVRATVNQMRATQLAMAAIQRVTGEARLVATEDLGYTHSTSALRYQAAFENERRWLTFDLLHGRVDRTHALWAYLCRTAPVRSRLCEIADAAANPALRPAVHGINHYLTSERFLDEAMARYPPASWGGNGQHRYADVEAVRVLRDGPLGPQRMIEQACQRYDTPVAVTEAHLACTREQQMLWLHEVWTAASGARACGHDVRAVTAWSAFGAFDWRSLLTRDEGAYESGLFDVRACQPRATGLVPMVRALATRGAHDHPALDAIPWWSRADRLMFPPKRGTTAREQSGAATTRPVRPVASRSLLIAGGAGTLGAAFGRLAEERGLRNVRAARRELDITDEAAIAQWLETTRPWAVVNGAGWVRVDDAELDIDGCMRDNTLGAECLAFACARAGIPLVTFSSDLVFGGDIVLGEASVTRVERRQPYIESDAVDPCNVYGRSKAEAERRVQDALPGALVVRTSAFFGDWDDWNFVSHTLAAVYEGHRALAPTDCVVSPTYVTDLVHAVLDLLIDGESGVWHLANTDAVSWLELAQRAAEHAGLDASAIDGCQCADIGWVAPRPAYSALRSERASLLGPLDDALARYARSGAWKRVARVHRGSFTSNTAESTLSMR
ncbi:MAG: sugar nucleotide-binding protein [Gemmatimonas sp.]